jgi:hypothetical protein
MGKAQKDGRVIKMQVHTISEDEDTDCFGNFDAKELLTCQECGLKTECKTITDKLKKEGLLDSRALTENVISESKKVLENNTNIVSLISRLSDKQKQVENDMKNSETKIVKKSKSSDKPAKAATGEKKASKPRVACEYIDGTVVPVSFKSFYDQVKKVSKDVVTTKSVSNFLCDRGIFCCTIKSGSSDSNLEIFFNRSSGSKLSTDLCKLRHDNKGSAIISVPNSKDGIAEAVALVTAWKDKVVAGVKSKKSEKPVKTEKSEKAEKPAKAEKSEKSSKSDKPAKTEKSEKAEKTSKSDKPTKSDKKVTKAIKDEKSSKSTKTAVSPVLDPDEG